jgi:sugar/nucleoside kinase (ribokinase family)
MPRRSRSSTRSARATPSTRAFSPNCSARGSCRSPRSRILTRGAIEAALSLAIRAAAVTVSRAGANPPWAHEI